MLHIFCYIPTYNNSLQIYPICGINTIYFIMYKAMHILFSFLDLKIYKSGQELCEFWYIPKKHLHMYIMHSQLCAIILWSEMSCMVYQNLQVTINTRPIVLLELKLYCTSYVSLHFLATDKHKWQILSYWLSG